LFTFLIVKRPNAKKVKFLVGLTIQPEETSIHSAVKSFGLAESGPFAVGARKETFLRGEPIGFHFRLIRLSLSALPSFPVGLDELLNCSNDCRHVGSRRTLASIDLKTAGLLILVRV
jgi:hypothetical protein